MVQHALLFVFKSKFGLEERGDYWDRMKKKVFSKADFDADLESTKPQTIADLDNFFKETETGKKYVQEFEDVLSFPTTAQFQTQLPEKSIGNL